MKHYIYSIHITILKLLYLITFGIILAANNNNDTLTEHLTEYKTKGFTEQMKDIKRTLTVIFPFLRFIDGLCVQSNRKNYHGVDPLNLGKCEKIKSLNFESSYLIKLPEYIMSFKSIENLNLYDNKLEISCFDIISQLSTLRVLNIAYNSIEKISEIILKLVNLKKLSIGGNCSIIIMDYLYKLNLKVLELYNITLVCKKTEDKIKRREIVFKIINKFLENKTLESLMLFDINLAGFDFDNEEYYLKRLIVLYCKISTLPISITKLKELEYLDLTWNEFKIVPSVLSRLENLKELYLTRNPITSYENIFFHSLEILHIEWDQRSNLRISINNSTSPLIYLHISTNSYYYNEISFESSTIKHLKGLYQYGESRLELSNHEDILDNLEVLRTNADFGTNNDINIISKLESLRELQLRVYGNSDTDFIKNVFLRLQGLKNLESLELINCFNNYKMLYYDTICHLENIKKLRITKYYIKCIECFRKIKNLQYTWFEDIKFYESKYQVNTFMKKKGN